MHKRWIFHHSRFPRLPCTRMRPWPRGWLETAWSSDVHIASDQQNVLIPTMMEKNIAHSWKKCIIVFGNVGYQVCGEPSCSFHNCRIDSTWSRFWYDFNWRKFANMLRIDTKYIYIYIYQVPSWSKFSEYYSEGPLGIIIPDPFWWVFYGFPVVQPLSHTYPFQTWPKRGLGIPERGLKWLSTKLPIDLFWLFTVVSWSFMAAPPLCHSTSVFKSFGTQKKEMPLSEKPVSGKPVSEKAVFWKTCFWKMRYVGTRLLLLTRQLKNP